MSTPTDPSTLRRLEPAVVKQILEAPAKETHAILDVRDLDEVAEGAIAGRTHLESGAFSDAAQVDALLDGPLKGKEKVIVHCMHSQKRGPACAAKLADRIKAREAEGKTGGPEVVVLSGGYHQFAQQFGSEDKLIVKGLPKEE
jgi:Cdc25 family phosphatase